MTDRFRAAPLDATVWRHWWGAAAVDSGSLLLSSAASSRRAETHSSLVTTRSAWGDFSLGVDVKPIRQLRRNDPPNAWETGWVMFRFRDRANYYYFALKPNGWELGKKQGSDAQIFLATGTSPRLPVGKQARIALSVAGARIRAAVDGVPVLDFVDPRPLRKGGAVGLYEEDAAVRFSRVTLVSS